MPLSGLYWSDLQFRVFFITEPYTNCAIWNDRDLDRKQNRDLDHKSRSNAHFERIKVTEDGFILSL